MLKFKENKDTTEFIIDLKNEKLFKRDEYNKIKEKEHKDKVEIILNDINTEISQGKDKDIFNKEVICSINDTL